MTHRDAVQSSATERYLLDEMSDQEKEAFEEHFFECAECATDVRAAALMRDGSKSGLLERTNLRSIAGAARPAAPAAGRWRLATVMPWAAAASFALIAGYQTLSREISRPVASQVLAPITLRSETRGAEPSVSLSAASSAVTLAMPLSATGDGELTYDLRTASGQSVASGRSTTPQGGAPLLLLLPASTLRAGERYVLTIRRGPDGTMVDEYRFSVSS